VCVYTCGVVAFQAPTRQKLQPHIWTVYRTSGRKINKEAVTYEGHTH